MKAAERGNNFMQTKTGTFREAESMVPNQSCAAESTCIRFITQWACTMIISFNFLPSSSSKFDISEFVPLLIAGDNIKRKKKQKNSPFNPWLLTRRAQRRVGMSSSCMPRNGVKRIPTISSPQLSDSWIFDELQAALNITIQATYPCSFSSLGPSHGDNHHSSQNVEISIARLSLPTSDLSANLKTVDKSHLHWLGYYSWMFKGDYACTVRKRWWFSVLKENILAGEGGVTRLVSVWHWKMQR